MGESPASVVADVATAFSAGADRLLMAAMLASSSWAAVETSDSATLVSSGAGTLATSPMPTGV